MTFTLLNMSNREFISKTRAETNLICISEIVPKLTSYFADAIIKDDYGESSIFYRTINNWYTGKDDVIWDRSFFGQKRYNASRIRIAMHIHDNDRYIVKPQI